MFSDDDKVIIQNDIDEHELNAYEICQLHKKKRWNYRSVKRLVKAYKERGTMARKKGSGRPRTVRTEENEENVEEHICS